MVRQIRTARVDTNADGAYSTPLGIVLETDRDAATFADPSYSGSGPAGIVLGGGLAPIGALAQGAAVPALLGRNDATGLDGSGRLRFRSWRRRLRELRLLRRRRHRFGRLLLALRHGLERIRRFGGLLLILLLILGPRLPSAKVVQKNNNGAKHRGSQAAVPGKHHLDGFLSTLRYSSRDGAFFRPVSPRA